MLICSKTHLFIFMSTFYIYACLYSNSCYIFHIHVYIFIFMLYFYIHAFLIFIFMYLYSHSCYIFIFIFMLYFSHSCIYIHIHVIFLYSYSSYVFHIHDLILSFMVCLFIFMVCLFIFTVLMSRIFKKIHIHGFDVPDLKKNHSTFFWERQLILVCGIQDLYSGDLIDMSSGTII